MPEWTDIGDEDIVEDDDVAQIFAGSARLAVYKIDDTIYVTDDRCTHQEATLSDGYLDGRTIECPRHQGVFDICTGKALGPPLEQDLRTYEVRIADGRVLVDLSPRESS
jgi:naphthalene 1,2-dioxygenase system ferredoxin subunit